MLYEQEEVTGMIKGFLMGLGFEYAYLAELKVTPVEITATYWYDEDHEEHDENCQPYKGGCVRQLVLRPE